MGLTCGRLLQDRMDSHAGVKKENKIIFFIYGWYVRIIISEFYDYVCFKGFGVIKETL
jgi:hypothetical protein